MDFKTLSKKVAGYGRHRKCGGGQGGISISGSVLSEFAPDFIAAIADLIMNPALPAGELERIKGKFKKRSCGRYDRSAIHCPG